MSASPDMMRVSVSAAVTIIIIIITSLILHSNAQGKDDDKKCDLYKGRWVFDESYPLYESEKCPLILQQFNCRGNGRPDLRYQKYRWQPNNCNLTRWDFGREFGRRMRGKRIMFVGDSISMNQWQSLVCIIYAAYPHTIPSLNYTALLSTFRLPELNLSLMYMRNALMVDIAIERGVKVLKLDSIAATAKQWLQSDVLIFDTWHWWLHIGRKQPWDMIQDGKVLKKDMDRLQAYEKALKTWRKWINKNVDANKIKLFFQGVSPDHWNGSDWGIGKGEQCKGEVEPLKQVVGGRGPGEGTTTTTADMTLKKVLKKGSVELLDIHRLSEYRVDGHPSIYGNPMKKGMDCTHWCLPGVPDAWNQLLYATLLNTFSI